CRSRCFLAHKCFLPVVAVAVVAVACDIHAERHLAKAGGSNCKLRGIPTLAMERSGMERAERERRSAQAQRGRLGKRLAGARGGAPLRGFGGCFSGRRCGQEQARRGGWRMTRGAGRRQGGHFLPLNCDEEKGSILSTGLPVA